MGKCYGFIPSKITDKTVKFSAPKSMELPEAYSYKKYLPPVGNQGSAPYCVPFSISAWFSWKLSMKCGEKKDAEIKYAQIYNSKSSEGNNGMTYTEAFRFLKEKGVKCANGKAKIAEAGYIPNFSLLKAAIVANGPCFGALPVYNSEVTKFWEKGSNSTLEGFHSVAIVGYDKDGYIIRNSWGPTYGKDGYAHISNEDAEKFREIWTILG